MTYIARFARQNRAPGPTNPELTTRIKCCPKLYMKQLAGGMCAQDTGTGTRRRSYFRAPLIDWLRVMPAGCLGVEK